MFQISRLSRGLIGVLFLLSLILTACSAPAATPEAPTSAPATGDEVETGKLSVMIWGGPTDIETIEKAIASYREANPGVEIDILLGDCGVSYAACKTLIAGGTMPDVFVPGIWGYDAMVSDGVLLSLDDYLARDSIKLEDFVPAAQKMLSSSVDGKVYGMPMGFNIQSIYYNKDMFDQAGLAYPPADGSYTWEDLREWAKVLTLDANGNNAASPDFDADNIVQWGFWSHALSPIPVGFEPTMLAYGGGIMTQDRQTCNIESEGSIQALKLLQEMIFVDHSMVSPDAQLETPGSQRWVNGQVAMQQGSHEQVLAVAAQNPDLKYDMAAMPKGPAGNASSVQMHLWSIYNKSENKDLAWDLIKFLTTDERAGGAQMGLIPAYKDLAMGPLFLQAPGEPEHLKEAQLDPAFWDLTLTPTLFNQKDAEIEGEDGIGPVIKKIFYDNVPVEEAVAGLCDKVNAIMEQ
jgi:multiple sugar transport system substrate-binding protein